MDMNTKIEARYTIVEECRLYIALKLLDWTLTWLPSRHPACKHAMAAVYALTQE